LGAGLASLPDALMFSFLNLVIIWSLHSAELPGSVNHRDQEQGRSRETAIKLDRNLTRTDILLAQERWITNRYTIGAIEQFKFLKVGDMDTYEIHSFLTVGGKRVSIYFVSTRQQANARPDIDISKCWRRYVDELMLATPSQIVLHNRNLIEDEFKSFSVVTVLKTVMPYLSDERPTGIPRSSRNSTNALRVCDITAAFLVSNLAYETATNSIFPEFEKRQHLLMYCVGELEPIGARSKLIDTVKSWWKREEGVVASGGIRWKMKILP
jgi:hypothetical protein